MAGVMERARALTPMVALPRLGDVDVDDARKLNNVRQYLQVDCVVTLSLLLM